MPKTLVNIITDDNPIPAYLFIKEKYEDGDRLMYISAKDTEDDLDALSELFSVPATHIDEIVLRNHMDECTYEKICRTILTHLNKDTHYCVNLAGGTRYMALAVQQVFEKFNSTFYYVQVDENLIVQSIFDDSIYDNDDIFYPIKHRMTISEYLRAHEINTDVEKNGHEPIRSEEEVTHFFKMFANNKLTGNDYDTMELLRINYRNKKKVCIQEVETSTKPQCPAVPYLTSFLNHIRFIPSTNGMLNRDELEYLTGGWFEEYVYYQVKKHINPQDIAIGIHITRNDNTNHRNELDVVFTKGNKLFVIECKTGVQTYSMFNEIVYKVCAIKEALLGVSCYSFIFSLKKDDDKDKLKRIAEHMGLTFIDYDILKNPSKLKMAMVKMDIQAKDNPTINQ